jgi:hypothetical protein
MTTRVSDLPATTALDADDEFYVVEDGSSRKTTLAQFALGWGQNWQNLTASRAVATPYQNTTGKPIMVSIEPSSATPGQFEVSVDGVGWIRLGTIILTGADVRQGSWLVPTGHFYRLTAGGFSFWAELR